jgi:tetratricopeptide (TPR) repeat protein
LILFIVDELMIAQGISYLRLSQPEKAVPIFESLISRNPNHEEGKIYYGVAGNSILKSVLERGNALVSNGKFQEALDVYCECKLQQSQHLNSALLFQLANNRAVCLLNTGKSEDALEIFDEALGLVSPSNGSADGAAFLKSRLDLLLNKGIVLKSLSRNDEAVVVFREGLQLAGDAEDMAQMTITLHCGISEAQSAARHFDLARDSASEGLAVSVAHGGSENAQASSALWATSVMHCFIARAFAYLKLKQSDLALADLEEAEKNSKNAKKEDTTNSTDDLEIYRLKMLAYSGLGDQAFESSDFATAVQRYDEALRVSSLRGPKENLQELSVILFNCALAHMQLSDISSAITMLKRVTTQSPNHFQGFSALGLCLLQLTESSPSSTASGYNEEAVAAFQAAHALQPEDIEVLHNLAVAYLRIQDPNSAATHFRQILKQVPDNSAALNGLALAEEQAAVSASTKMKPQTSAQTNTPEPKKESSTAPPPAAPQISTIRGNSFTKNASFSGPKQTESNVNPPKPASTSSSRSWQDVLASVASTYPLSNLVAPGPYPADVDTAFRELYLTESEFQSVLGCSRQEFYSFPAWKQVSCNDAL